MEHFHEDDVVGDFTQNVENDSPKRENVRFVEMIKLVKKLKMLEVFDSKEASGSFL